jgi:hypothetical protein
MKIKKTFLGNVVEWSVRPTQYWLNFVLQDLKKCRNFVEEYLFKILIYRSGVAEVWILSVCYLVLIGKDFPMFRKDRNIFNQRRFNTINLLGNVCLNFHTNSSCSNPDWIINRMHFLKQRMKLYKLLLLLLLLLLL